MMKPENKQTVIFGLRMMACSIFALLLHPLVWIVGREALIWGIDFHLADGIPVIFYLVVYGIVGAIGWRLFHSRKWWVLSILLFLAINVVMALALFVSLAVEPVGDGMTWLLVLTASLVAALLSAIPISLTCKWYKDSLVDKNKEDKTIINDIEDTDGKEFRRNS